MEWTAANVLPLKRNGSPRFGVDYCNLNAVTEHYSYPKVRAYDCTDSPGESPIILYFGRFCRYWPVEIGECDTNKTSITSPTDCTESPGCNLPIAMHPEPTNQPWTSSYHQSKGNWPLFTWTTLSFSQEPHTNTLNKSAAYCSCCPNQTSLWTCRNASILQRKLPTWDSCYALVDWNSILIPRTQHTT